MSRLDRVVTIKQEPQDYFRPTFRDFHSCPGCHYQTKSYLSIRTHLKLHKTKRTWFECIQTVPDYKCPKCRFHNHQFITFKKHKCRRKRKNRKPLETFTSYSCRDCDFATYSVLMLMKHNIECVKKRTNQRITVYNLRRREYNKCYSFFIHIKNTSVEWLKCQECPFMARMVGSSSSDVVKEHSHYSWFECELCFFNVEQIFHLRQHILKEHAGGEEVDYEEY